ncbi:MAG: hypothetical protein U0935_02065 [Pirellulales bacterium]
MIDRNPAVRMSVWLLLMVLLPTAGVLRGQEPRPNEARPAEIDFHKAGELLRRQRAGEKLTPDEDAYLRRAREARQKATSRPGSRVTPRETTGLIPLNQMTAADRYQGEDGGLYGAGRNEPPAAHLHAAQLELARIQPLAANGEPDMQGQVVFLSISMSNATQEFSRFKRLADREPQRARHLTIVDGAQGGQAMAEWARPQAPPWTEAERRIAAAGVTSRQVQVAWIKPANKSPTGDLAEHGQRLRRDTLAVLQEAKRRFPNLRIAYLSSRIYGGYAAGNLNPEPYAYESAFVVRWLIQAQMAGDAELNYLAERGPVRVPLLLWGPYLWADGTTPRASDQLTYTRDDLAGDGTHPSNQGQEKVARLLLDFFQHDPLASSWFRERRPQ